MKHNLQTGFLSAVWALISALSTGSLWSQGEQAWTFIDESRNGRQIASTVFYPAGAGPFPVVVFGHGFVMNTPDYGALFDGLVEAEFVVVSVETEGGFAPDHADFGLDLAFVAGAAAAELTALPCTVDAHAAIGGHSMGGGAAWLAAASGSIDAVFGLAPAETNPSAIDAASEVTVPSLVFTGTSDAVTPPADHHLPIHNQTASSCKALVTLIDGGHCGYADAGSLCDFGELLFNGMTRERQQEVTLERLIPWLNHWLRGEDWAAFQLADEPDVTLEVGCAMGAESDGRAGIRVWPQPFADQIQFQGLPPLTACSVFDALGRRHWEGRSDASGSLQINASGWPSGLSFFSWSGAPAIPLVKSETMD